MHKILKNFIEKETKFMDVDQLDNPNKQGDERHNQMQSNGFGRSNGFSGGHRSNYSTQ